MLIWVIFKLAIRSLYANKMRSFLAMLGIIIGVTAVISMLAFAAGASSQIMDRIKSLGTNLLVIRPGQRGMRGVTQGSFQSLTLEDAQEMLLKINNIRQIAPAVRGSGQVKYLNKNSRTSIIGTASTYFAIRNFELEQGRSFTEGEVNHRMRVAILGPTTKTNLFETTNPIGKTIKINRLSFEIIGVLKSKSDGGGDDQIIIPYTTAMKQILGIIHVHEINVETTDQSVLEDVEDDIAKILRRRHRLAQDAPDDFNIMNLQEFLDMASKFSNIFTLLLGGIASISLLVGGIGIMNIMLVTVTERTREIGIRKAVGAKERHILQQFLIESMLLSAVGGTLGVLLGAAICHIVASTTELAVLIETHSVLLALGFSAGVGIFFGYYPARRAARLDPIEALRYE